VKETISIDVNIPDGWRFVDYRVPEKGEYYSFEGKLHRCRENQTDKVFVIEKPEPDTSLAASVDVAERFLVDEDCELDFITQVAPAIRSLIEAAKEDVLVVQRTRKPIDDTPDPGEGWRWIRAGEILQSGDEVSKGIGYQATEDVGKPVLKEYTELYRRRVVMTEPPSVDAVGDGVPCWVVFANRDRDIAANSGRFVRVYWGDTEVPHQPIAWCHKLPGEDKPPQMLLDWEAEYRAGQDAPSPVQPGEYVTQYADTPSESKPPTLEDVPDGNLCVVKTGVANCRMYGAEARMKWKPHWTWGFISSQQGDSTPSESKRREWWIASDTYKLPDSYDQEVWLLRSRTSSGNDIHIREVLPTDPTPETVAEVAEELEAEAEKAASFGLHDMAEKFTKASKKLRGQG